MAQKVKLNLQHLNPIKVPVRVPAAPVPVRLSDNVSGKEAEDDPRPWAPALSWRTQMKS